MYLVFKHDRLYMCQVQCAKSANIRSINVRIYCDIYAIAFLYKFLLNNKPEMSIRKMVLGRTVNYNCSIDLWTMIILSVWLVDYDNTVYVYLLKWCKYWAGDKCQPETKSLTCYNQDHWSPDILHCTVVCPHDALLTHWWVNGEHCLVGTLLRMN